MTPVTGPAGSHPGRASALGVLRGHSSGVKVFTALGGGLAVRRHFPRPAGA